VKLTIFGGTGRAGQYLVRQALEAGYDVTVLVRTPSKLNIRHPHLTIVQGDMQDAACVAETIAGADAVLSVLGPTDNQPDYRISRGTQHILDAMRQHHVRRLIISTGAGVPDPNDEPKFINRLISLLLGIVSKHVLADMTQVVELVRASDLNWTIVRVPMLTDDALSGKVHVGWVGKGTGPRLSRADMAAFMLKQVHDETYVRQAPMISN
jgi:putative NADH-flavin reductase